MSAGVNKAIAQNGVKFDVVALTSIDANNPAVIAAGVDPHKKTAVTVTTLVQLSIFHESRRFLDFACRGRQRLAMKDAQVIK